jgi:hypothetical protein
LIKHPADYYTVRIELVKEKGHRERKRGED